MTATDQLLISRNPPDGKLSVLGYRVSVVDGFDPADPTTLTQRSMLVEPMVHPRLVSLFEGFTSRDPRPEHRGETRQVTRTGRFSFSFSSDAFSQAEPLYQALCLIRPHTFFQEDDILTRERKIVENIYGRRGFSYAYELTRLWRGYTSDRYQELVNNRKSWASVEYAGVGVVSVRESTTGMIYLRVLTNYPDEFYEDAGVDEDLRVPLHLALATRVVDPRPVLPHQALTAVELLDDHDVPVFFDEAFTVLRNKVRRSVTVIPAPGRPAQAHLVRPVEYKAELQTERQPLDTMPFASLQVAPVSTDELGELRSANDHLTWVIDPQVDDVRSMSMASPVPDVPDSDRSLRGYQREAIGLHLATEFGYLNALEPGMGKSIVALDAMRRRAAEIPSYRGLIVCEANVRSQWVGESQIWFPEATVVMVRTSTDVDHLAAALASDDPVVVITSYALSKTVLEFAPDADQVTVPEEEAGEESVSVQPDLGQMSLFAEAVEVETVPAGDEEAQSLGRLLADTFWHDLIADEAAVLKNTASAQTRALWQLRSNAGVAVALTGTPVTRTGVDDLARLISWTRGRRDLFSGHRLSTTFDVAKDEDLRELAEALGPTFFRRNKSDIADELVMVDAEVVRLEPHPAEQAVVSAAVAQLKAMLDELLALLEMLHDSDALTDEELETQRAELATARAALLGGSTVARRAASLPSTIRESNSTAAALLLESGLVEAAEAAGSTKERWTVATCRELVGEGKQALIFTEFSAVADHLAVSLAAEGIRVGKVVGGGGVARDRYIEEFRNGNLDVLVCTSSGKRGLNLQTASAIIHYDLPWTPDDVAQRNARVERIGATSDEVKVYYLTLAGTIEERVIALIAARSAEAVRVLDVSRGADASGTDMGRILAAVQDEVDLSVLSDRHATLIEVTRALVA